MVGGSLAQRRIRQLLGIHWIRCGLGITIPFQFDASPIAFSLFLTQADANLQYGQQFTVTKMHIVFEVDSLATSHPMSMPVSKRNEINELFDSIPYAKGIPGNIVMTRLVTY